MDTPDRIDATDEDAILARAAQINAARAATAAAEKAAADKAMADLVASNIFAEARAAMFAALRIKVVEVDLQYAIDSMDRLTARYATA